MPLCSLCKDYPEGTACAMAGCPGRSFKIDRTIRPVAGDADTLPNAAAPDIFAASVNHKAGETINPDRLPACDAFPPFVEHEKGDRA